MSGLQITHTPGTAEAYFAMARKRDGRKPRSYEKGKSPFGDGTYSKPTGRGGRAYVHPSEHVFDMEAYHRAMAGSFGFKR